MTEKIEIREDAQENGLVLCVCIAELLLLTQLFRLLLFHMHTKTTMQMHVIMLV